MPINNVLAGVAVRNLDAAQRWYEQVLAAPGSRPMNEVVEWTLAGGGALQVFEDADRAGKSSITLAVSDLDAQIAALDQAKIQIGKRSASDAVKIAIVEDPDGNRIVFAEAHSPTLAK
ncbi:MAG: VOC family protein [Myxococcales bacterium]|nr:VOC family protein [Myxococcales bacterium]